VSKHVYTCQVRFSDVDVYGHVNNVRYLEYYQEARLAALSALDRGADGGMPGHEPRGRLSLVVARVVVDYRRPIVFRPEPYLVTTWVEGTGRSSFELASAITDSGEPSGRPLSTARATLVRFDLAAQKAHPLTAEDRAVLDALAPP
jgi:acyl-CoA thioester hydrolase